MSKISRFTTKAVTVAKNAVGGRLRRLRCRDAALSADLPREIVPRDARSVERDAPNTRGDRPHHSTLVEAFDRTEMAVWRVLLRLSAFTNLRFVSPQNRRVILGRSCTSHQGTPLSIRRFSTARTPVHTAATERTIVSDTENDGPRRYSNPGDPRRSLYDHEATRYPARLCRSPAGTRATCTASPPTRATTGWRYARTYVRRA